ncbi:MAG: hypothetical protein JO082_00260 [Mycobacterium sp.]|nr:hypothetical protein [Mycobacterium sp.]MBV9720338.1 hypothetical protein [Mycobacterium sp.]
MARVEATEPDPAAGSHEIQSGVERPRSEVGDTGSALSGQLEAKKNAFDRSRAAAKPSLAIVASVAGVTVVGIVWWRRRSGRDD